MPTQDDERFENYLKQFRPIVPDALPLTAHSQVSRRPAVVRLWIAGIAALAIIGVVAFHITSNGGAHHHHAFQHSNAVSVHVVLPEQPLTVRDVNALLTAAPSYKSVVDSIAFSNQGSTIPQDKQSALAALSKEKIKL